MADNAELRKALLDASAAVSKALVAISQAHDLLDSGKPVGHPQLASYSVIAAVADELLKTRLTIKVGDLAAALKERNLPFYHHHLRLALKQAGFPMVGRNAQSRYLVRPAQKVGAGGSKDAVESASSNSTDLNNLNRG